MNHHPSASNSPVPKTEIKSEGQQVKVEVKTEVKPEIKVEEQTSVNLVKPKEEDNDSSATVIKVINLYY